jgi:hypothetical protein
MVKSLAMVVGRERVNYSVQGRRHQSEKKMPRREREREITLNLGFPMLGKCKLYSQEDKGQ